MSDNIRADEPRPIGVQIRSMRNARGWSLAALARRVGSSAPTLHRYENGWDRFELATLRKIASALGARLDVRLTPGIHREVQTATPSSRRLLRLLSPLFWDRDLASADLVQYPDWVLKRVLMFGNWKQVVAARQFYGDAVLIRATERRGVDARTRVFWNTMILGGGAGASESP